MSDKTEDKKAQKTSDSGTNSQDNDNKPSDSGSQLTPIPEQNPALVGIMQEGLENYEKRGIITESSKKK